MFRTRSALATQAVAAPTLASLLRPAPSALQRLGAPTRALCDAAADADEARKAELQEFLRSASRPIMGKAKARQSAGQKELDLTKQMKNLDDLDLHGLLRLGGEELKNRGVPCQIICV